MRVLLLVLLVLAAVGCARPARDWMKLNERYTQEDFRRDHAACSRGGRLDEACMRSRGWVDVSPTPEKPIDPRDGPGRKY